MNEGCLDRYVIKEPSFFAISLKIKYYSPVNLKVAEFDWRLRLINFPSLIKKLG